MVKKLVISNWQTITLILLLIPFYAILYKLYIPRITAFGCFDDCFNYVGGYFIRSGMHIYSDFFFNHQPIPAYISYFVQTITNPINIFELLLRHRQFILLFGFVFNALLIVRFKYVAVPSILIYELSKFYIFGDRFLAEGIIVYPTVYLFGLALFKLSNHKLYAIDYLLSALLAWFVIFSREPYAPLALVLFASILWGKIDQIKKTSVVIFAILTISIFLYIGNLREYYFDMVTFNLAAVIPKYEEVSMFGVKPIHVFFYPVYIFFYGGWNILKQLLIGIDILFLTYVFVLIKKRYFKFVMFVLFLLGLANLRAVVPGTLFYEAFHMIIWYSLFIFATSFLIFNYSKNNFVKILSLSFLGILLLIFVSSKYYFAYEKINEHADFLTQYGPILHAGETIKSLSSRDDLIFADRTDDLLYYASNRLSPYKYAWYTAQMNFFPKYTDERINMFKTNPPDFYKEFGTCPKRGPVQEDQTLPKFVRSQYIRLDSNNEPSCLFVHKDKLKEITPEQWKRAKEFLYALSQ